MLKLECNPYKLCVQPSLFTQLTVDVDKIKQDALKKT